MLTIIIISNVKVIMSDVYSLNVKVIISDVYILIVKVIISHEPWGSSTEGCATLDKGYSMLIGWLTLGQCFGVTGDWVVSLRHHSGCCVRARPNQLRQLDWVVRLSCGPPSDL